MKRMKLFGGLVVLLLMVLNINGCGYNDMQAKEESVLAAWGDVEATYQRRADQIGRAHV